MMSDWCWTSPRPTVTGSPTGRSLLMVSPSRSSPVLAETGSPLMKRAIPLSCMPAGSANVAEIARLCRLSIGLYPYSNDRPVASSDASDARCSDRSVDSRPTPSISDRDSVYDTWRLLPPRTRCLACISRASYQLLVIGRFWTTTRLSVETGRGLVAVTAPEAGRLMSAPPSAFGIYEWTTSASSEVVRVICHPMPPLAVRWYGNL